MLYLSSIVPLLGFSRQRYSYKNGQLSGLIVPNSNSDLSVIQELFILYLIYRCTLCCTHPFDPP